MRRVTRNIQLGFVGVTLVIAAGLYGIVFPAEDSYSKISVGLKTFGQVYKQISLYYVDEIDPEVFVDAAIRGMLGTLDPYTVFMKEDEDAGLQMLTSGNYGGVGIRLGMRDDSLTVISPIEGTPAGRNGIRSGDKIIRIDGKATKTLDLNEAANKIRGPKDTKVSLTIHRRGFSNTIDYDLIRELIEINDVVYSGFAAPGIGYIRLSGFSRNTDKNFELKFQELQSQGIEGLIVDLRDNPGGLLETAISLCDFFIPEGELIVSTRGRIKQMNKEHFAKRDMLLDENISLAVLVNGGSASASEIFAGVIQDRDRGIVIGNKTFGKGLVQTLFKMSTTTKVKITTAKYYIPSGRLIQREDYFNGKNVIISDSGIQDTSFVTLHGRKVYGGGGITPDIIITGNAYSKFVAELWRQSIFYKYTGYYTNRHPDVKTPVPVSSFDMADFLKFIDKIEFEYQNNSEAIHKKLIDSIEKDDYPATLVEKVERLGLEISSMKNINLDRDADIIKRVLSREVSERIGGIEGRYLAGFNTDRAILKAVSVLQDDLLYINTLGYHN